MDVFDLQAKITLDSSGFKRSLDTAAGDMQAFGSAVEGIIEGIGAAFAAAFAAAAAGTVALVEGAVEEYARFEQLVGGVDTLFKESSGVLQTYADAAFQTAGKSANEYMDTATSFAASLIQALGGDTAAATEMVDMAITDMADNINTFGGDMTMVENAYKGFARNSYVMLDNLKLGYSGTKAEMARLINDTGILGDTVVTVSTMTEQGNFDQVVSFATVVEAIHAVQESMGITGRTAQEAAGTIEGSVASMKAAWSNWLVGLGDENADLSGLTDNLIVSFETVADNVIPVVERIGESLVLVFEDLTGIDLSPVLNTFDTLRTSAFDIGTAFLEGGAAAGFEAITEKITEITGLDLSGVTTVFSGIAEGITEIAKGFAEGGFSGGLEAIVAQIESLTGLDLPSVNDSLSGISATFSEIKSAFSGDSIGNALGELASGFETLTGIDLSGVGESFAGISESFAGIGEAFSAGGLSGAFDELVSAFEDLTGIDLSGLKDGIGEFLGEIIKVDDSTLTSVGGAIQSVMDAFSGIDISGIISDAATAIGDFFAAFDDIAETVVSFAAEIVGQLARDFEDMAPGIAGVAAGIGIFAGGLAAIQAFSGIPALLTTISTAFSALNTVMAANPILLVVSVLGALATALVTAYHTNEDFRNSVDEAWAALKEGAATALEKLKETLGNIGDAISEAAQTVKNKVSEFIKAGRDLIQGLIDGITEKISSIGTAAKNAAEKVIGWFDTAFDRHSPSKVFAEMGRDLMRGLEVGIDDESKNVQRTIDGLRFTAPAIRMGKVDVSQSTMGKMSAASINNAIALAGSGNGQPVNVNLVVDGRTLAQVVFDPLDGLIKQKGVTLGA